MSDIARRVFSAPQFWLAGVLLAPVMSLVGGEGGGGRERLNPLGSVP